MQETLNYEADVQNIPNPQMIATPNTIGFDALTFQYPMSQVKNLQQISLSLKKAKRLALLVKREQVKQPSYANYCENTQSVRDSFPLTVSILPLKRRSRSSIGLVMCHKIMCYSHELFVKIYYLGKKMQHKQSCKEAIRAAYFEKDLDNLPMGLETLVGEKGVSLSGGQKQRVSIARALIKDPEILMLDDSLSAVDAKTEARIIENIQRERQGKTTIITTHRLSGIQHADVIIVLDDGQIVEQEHMRNFLRNKDGIKSNLTVSARRRCLMSTSQRLMRYAMYFKSRYY